VLGAFIERAQRVHHLAVQNRRVAMGRLDSVRDFFVVDDLLTLVEAMVSQNKEGILTNACSGIPRRVRDLVHFLNRLPGGGFEISEDNDTPTSASIAIGDPTRFLALAGRSSPTDLEPVLSEAWRQAMDDRASLPRP
jgi:hypothetical protein